MPNPRLTDSQRKELFAPLFELIKSELKRLSDGDEKVLWALRRKLTKELGYLERGTPAERNSLKKRMFQLQEAKCPLCFNPMELKNSELDRFEAFLGYTESNVRLVHHECHIKDQEEKGYS